MIFPNIELEPVVQVNDRTRLNVSKSFVTQNEAAITLVQVRPTASDAFINVTSDLYLDWSYSSPGTYTVTARVTASGASAQISDTIQVVTATVDNLFSNDSDLKLHEPDILKWVDAGRNSFLNVHRRAQDLILGQLRREGYTDFDGVPYTKAAIVDIEEVRQWSTFWTLELIFEGLSNAVDDVFAQKASRYSSLRQRWEATALLRLDTDGDGTADTDEGVDTGSCFVARR